MKVAIIHDWLTNMGGAEQVVINFHKCFPEAPIYTTFYTPNNLSDELKNIEVHTSFLQKKNKDKINHKKYFPLMPLAFENFDLNEYDVVLSSSSSCAKGVLTKPRKYSYMLLSYTYALCLGKKRRIYRRYGKAQKKINQDTYSLYENMGCSI